MSGFPSIIEARSQIQGYHAALTVAYVFRRTTDRITDRVASLNLDREMCRTKRFQEIPRVKDLASSEDARLLTPQVDDSLRGFHDDWRCDGVNVLAACDCGAFCIASARDRLDEECLRRSAAFVDCRRS